LRADSTVANFIRHFYVHLAVCHFKVTEISFSKKRKGLSNHDLTNRTVFAWKKLLRNVLHVQRHDIALYSEMRMKTNCCFCELMNSIAVIEKENVV